MKTNNPMTAITTRPILARILRTAGYSVTPPKSIFDPHMTEWEFFLDAQSAEIVQAFYDEIKKPLPMVIRKYMEDAHV